MNFLAKHNKSYSTEEEYNMRMKMYSKRVKEHKRHNAEPGQTSFMGVNFLTDWSQKEIDEKLGGGFKKTFLNQESTK